VTKTSSNEANVCETDHPQKQPLVSDLVVALQLLSSKAPICPRPSRSLAAEGVNGEGTQHQPRSRCALKSKRPAVLSGNQSSILENTAKVTIGTTTGKTHPDQPTNQPTNCNHWLCERASCCCHLGQAAQAYTCTAPNVKQQQTKRLAYRLTWLTSPRSRRER
jgi:hypothetical protein